MRTAKHRINSQILNLFFIYFHIDIQFISICDSPVINASRCIVECSKYSFILGKLYKRCDINIMITLISMLRPRWNKWTWFFVRWCLQDSIHLCFSRFYQKRESNVLKRITLELFDYKPSGKEQVVLIGDIVITKIKCSTINKACILDHAKIRRKQSSGQMVLCLLLQSIILIIKLWSWVKVIIVSSSIDKNRWCQQAMLIRNKDMQGWFLFLIYSSLSLIAWQGCSCLSHVKTIVSSSGSVHRLLSSKVATVCFMTMDFQNSRRVRIQCTSPVVNVHGSRCFVSSTL